MELLETISKHASPDTEVEVHGVIVEDEFHADRHPLQTCASCACYHAAPQQSLRH
ncbi:MAG: hypothetical protein JSS01_19235 [Proteobacteria bacterium]|nr:hypothetical protein [Pseudomonadota bacterium]